MTKSRTYRIFKPLAYGALMVAFVLFFSACNHKKVNEPTQKLWHGQSREIRYQPDGNGFVITNGTKRFNRALYGSHTAFRVEAGDLPEFALYMPRIGGTLRLGLIQADSSKWLIDAENITARYEAGTMTYRIKDPLLNKGEINLQLLALPDADGMVLKITSKNVPENVELFWAFGGASDKRLSRDGDLGADPESSFYLKAENCTDNEYFIDNNSFRLYYGSGRSLSDNEVYENNYKPSKEEIESTQLTTRKRIFGFFPAETQLKLVDASYQKNPLQLLSSEKENSPVIAARQKLHSGNANYILLVNPDTKQTINYDELPELFKQADIARKELADHIKINTPDKYINAVGASLSTAADAVWDGQSFMHGAIAWRMPLNGWRGAYAADWLGWHDRAKTHFRGYFEAQYTEPASGPSVPDQKTNLARQKEEVGTALFTNGYISRNPGKINKPHHYDMNLVFIAQLLSHFNWTGDLEFLKESWPVLERHLAWEKRNFDANNDGLYDAYCCIWASDALQYSGGGVTHSSAYNYRANKTAAELAALIGKDPAPYLAEAKKIKTAVNQQLWLPEKGWFAEYKDLLGNQLVHPSAALWTVYHSIDEGLADPFQAYQATQYVDHSIPKIPVEANGLASGKYYTLSTTNWMPYTWSINNVAFAEVLHTALAYWQSGRNEEAFTLTKSVFLDYMFMGSSPGNFGQLSYYDAFRDELYRDFSDPVGTASRAFVEGLFGIAPDLINKKISIKPGWPAEWEFAGLETPDINLQFEQKGNTDRYLIETKFGKEITLELALKAKSSQIKSVKINDKDCDWTWNKNAIGTPELQLISLPGTTFKFEIEWNENTLQAAQIQEYYASGEVLSIGFDKSEIIDIYDPQKILKSIEQTTDQLQAVLQGETGWRTFFVQLKQGEAVWWQPFSFELRNPISILASKNQPKNEVLFNIQNNSAADFKGKVALGNFSQNFSIPAKSTSENISVLANNLVPGSNIIHITTAEKQFSEKLINWNVQTKAEDTFDEVDLSEQFNSSINHIFDKQYFSPRSRYPTLSIPTQGIGDWCSYREHEEIDDTGIRILAAQNGQIIAPQGIPLKIPANNETNIVFTSQWDNHPEKVELPLEGKASHLYLLMAGSMHHMQINMTNGLMRVEYTDGTFDDLQLKSPDNWWPIEQDYYEDGFAFQLPSPQPPRLYLKTGEWHLDSYNVLAKNKTIKIEGGAASLLDLALNPEKELKTLTLETYTNDVVIGLMAATLKREVN
ncbi:DUF4450 domain-containing protein [uncultured Draconibacterium sp.]|uniref:DUF4450 domain-containing protein n=1 Tax=uncultured Draconibacterium sp. TaxID=1573823 RepID=UPI003216D5AD